MTSSPASAYWLNPPFAGSAVFRLEFETLENRDAELQIAAVPGFRLSLDGKYVAVSHLQFTRERVFLERVPLHVTVGRHQLEVLLIDYGECSPRSRMILPRGLYVLAEGVDGTTFNTGVAAWRCRRETRFSFARQELKNFQCVGGALHFDNRISVPDELLEPVRAEIGNDVRTFRQVRCSDRKLDTSLLPPFCEREITSWRILAVDHNSPGSAYPVDPSSLPDSSEDKIFFLPSHSSCRILIGFEHYCCCREQFQVRDGNGGEIVISWAEALFGTPEETEKGDRMEWAGKYFRGLCDRFFPGPGENAFFNFDYRAGRYAEICITSGSEPLEFRDLKFYENRYPLEFAGEWHSSDPRLNALVAPAFRTLQMCAHDTLMDCPYYEQLMYIGDGRLQLLAGYVSAGEAFGALADHVMELWAEGIREDGIFMSIYPAQAFQIVPGFSLIFLLAVCDYIRYRDRREVSAQIFPLGVRSLIAWENSLEADGLLRINRGWRFIDWVEGWSQGVPPGAETQAHCIFNALYAYVLKEFAEICRWKNEPELAARFSRRHAVLLQNIIQRFYVPEAGLFSDLAGENIFSEHANVLMLLAGVSDPAVQQQVAETLFAPGRKIPLTQASLYFSFYYLEAAAETGFMNAFFQRLYRWEAVEKLHLDTMPETSEPTRSDCHGWSAHILYHLYATIAGIRPSAPGGRSFSVRPHPGHLTAFSGCMASIAKTVNFSWPPEA